MATDPTSSLSPLKRAVLALDDMASRLQAAERARNEPIAVVGIGCRFPGADGPEAFWRLLRDGTNAVREVPRERWDLEAYYDPDPSAAGKTYTRWGAFLEDTDRFDPQFFGIAPREAIGMDPQQRLLLEVAWEALEHAAIAPDRLSGSTTGVFVGISNTDYAMLCIESGNDSHLDAYAASGTAHSVAAGRISYVLGLQGPSVALDTACSSSLVAVHLACQSLRAGECRAALAGGVHLLLTPQSTITLCKLKMLAADGRCKTFDAAGDGFVEGEGCGLVVLKRLSDALADGDNILAVIRGSAVNQDGASSSLTAPNARAQEAVVHEALQRAGVRPAAVGYVEAHGTGTSLGDPIEIQALCAVLGRDRSPSQPLLVGSVKTNIGHTQAAAGIAGLIKAILALQHEEIPPHLHLRDPNPHIPWTTLPVKVTTNAASWRRGPDSRIAGVSSFGFSGTNVHVIVEEAPVRVESSPTADRPLHVLTLSARSEPALSELAGRWERGLAAAPAAAAADVAFTANVGRAHFAHRLAVVVGSGAELRAGLAAASSGTSAPGVTRAKRSGSDPPRVTFLFTGQGAQYAGMGRELYDTQPTFRRAIDRCAALLQDQLDRPLLDLLYSQAADPRAIDQTGYAQPALFALEFALAELWKSWGVVPSSVLGHSVGEYAAACVAGVFSLEDALKLISARGRLMQSLPSGGAMAAIFADEDRIRAAVERLSLDVAVAAINGPENTVVSGSEPAVAALQDAFAQQGVASERLAVSHAFHSALMIPILPEFGRAAAGVKFSSPRITLVSNLTGQRIRDEIADAAYWQRHLREPVRFAQGVGVLYEMGCRIFVEIGPKPTLSGLASRTVPGGAVWLPSLRRGRRDWQQMLEAVAALYSRGVDIDWAGFDRDYPRRKLVMPTYPFERARYWLADSPSRTRRVATTPREPHHPLLGSRRRSPLPSAQFESALSTGSPAFLADHSKRGTAILPATAYLEMGFAAAREVLGPGQHTVDELAFGEPLELRVEPASVQTVVTVSQKGTANFQLFSLDRAPGDVERWRLHASGTLRADAPTPCRWDALEEVRARCVESLPVEPYYDRVLADGHEYGPSFRGLVAMWRGRDEAFARLELPPHTVGEADDYTLHPALLDAAFQLVGVALPETVVSAALGDTYVPSSVASCRVHRRGVSQAWSHVRLRPSADPEAISVDVHLYDDEGTVIAQVAELSLRRLTTTAGARAATVPSLFEVAWRHQVRGSKPNTADASGEIAGAWVVFADGGDLGPRLARRLEQHAKVAVVECAAASTAPSRVDPTDPAQVTRAIDDACVSLGPRLIGVVHVSSDDVSTTDEPEMAVAASCGSLLHVVQALAAREGQRPRLAVVTRGAVAIPAASRDVSVVHAPIWGLARTVDSEHPDLGCTCIDLDPLVGRSGAADGPELDLLVSDILAPDAERQIAIRDGRRYVARLTPAPPAIGRERSDSDRAVALEIGAAGLLDRLEVRAAMRRTPGEGEIEVRVAAAGLNFRDVLKALGVYEGEPGPLGSECVGTVVAIGSGVAHLAVGDQVLGMADGGLRSYVTAPAATFVRKPAEVSVEEAATIPVAFLTVEYALNRLARVKRGERILIHAAAGGVGLAAVQLAQRAGAEVFATAGSPDKHAFLRSLGVRHVFSSRTLNFAVEIAAITGGEGVHIVLNSLAGEFIDKSLAVLGNGGRFLEIGKASIWTPDRMAAVRPDVAYFPIYLGQVDPTIVQDMLCDLVPAFTSGTLRPLPRRTFALGDAVNAFRFMAQAHHIGKIVLTIDAPAPAVRPDASYLITGGLGALGLHVARRLVELGARHVALVGRTDPSAAARDALGQLEQMGAEVLILRADVSVAGDVRKLLEEVSTRMPPLRGVVHAAGVLDDGVLTEQTWPRFANVMAPKVAGTWHLHRSTAELPLDFFVMFSSIASILGGTGQGNYAAANAFLDALAHHRRARHLPAVSVNWGPWAGAGMAGTVTDRDRRRRHDQGFEAMAVDDGLAVFASLLTGAAPVQVAASPVDWSKVLQQFAPGSAPSLLAEIAAIVPRSQTATPARADRSLLGELEGMAPSKRESAVRERIRREAVKVLGLEAGARVDSTQPLRELGLDSLMAVELRNTLSAALERTLPATLLFKYPSIEALTNFVTSELAGPLVAEPSAAAADAAADDAAILALSDDQTRELLALELQALGSSLDNRD